MILRVAWRTRARVRVGAARAPRGTASASRPRRSTRSRPAPTPSAWTPLEADLLAGDRPAHRSLPHRRRHVGPPGGAARRAPARRARVRRRHLHRPGDGVQQLRARSSTPSCRASRPHHFPSSRSRQCSRSRSRPRAAGRRTIPELGTEPVSYEDSISPEIYELEREAIFKRGVAERRAGRAAAAQGELLHQGARRREHVGRHRPRHGRRGARVPQHLPAPRQQARVDRLPAGGVERQLPASSCASTTAGSTTSTARARSCSRRASSSTSTRPTTGSSPCTATCGRGSSS